MRPNLTGDDYMACEPAELREAEYKMLLQSVRCNDKYAKAEFLSADWAKYYTVGQVDRINTARKARDAMLDKNSDSPCKEAFLVDVETNQHTFTHLIPSMPSAWAFLFLGPQAPLSCANSHVGSGFCDLPRTFNIQGPVDGSLPQAICTAAEIIARKRFQFICDAELSELLPWPDHKSLEARTVGTSCFLYD